MQEQQCKPACAGTLLSAAVNPQLSTSTTASLITGRLSQPAGNALGWQQKVQLAYHSLRVMSSEAAVSLQRLVTVHASSVGVGGGGGFIKGSAGDVSVAAEASESPASKTELDYDV